MTDLIKELESKVVNFPYPTAFDVNKYVKLNDVKELLKAINYTRCCETLPCSYAEGYNDAIAKIKEEAKYIDKQ